MSWQMQSNFSIHLEWCFTPCETWKLNNHSWILKRKRSFDLLESWMIILCRFVTRSDPFHITDSHLKILISGALSPDISSDKHLLSLTDIPRRRTFVILVPNCPGVLLCWQIQWQYLVCGPHLQLLRTHWDCTKCPLRLIICTCSLSFLSLHALFKKRQTPSKKCMLKAKTGFTLCAL